jgi:hypothetical protein
MRLAPVECPPAFPRRLAQWHDSRTCGSRRRRTCPTTIARAVARRRNGHARRSCRCGSRSSNLCPPSTDRPVVPTCCADGTGDQVLASISEGWTHNTQSHNRTTTLLTSGTRTSVTLPPFYPVFPHEGDQQVTFLQSALLQRTSTACAVAPEAIRGTSTVARM